MADILIGKPSCRSIHCALSAQPRPRARDGLAGGERKARVAVARAPTPAPWRSSRCPYLNAPPRRQRITLPIMPMMSSSELPSPFRSRMEASPPDAGA